MLRYCHFKNSDVGSMDTLRSVTSHWFCVLSGLEGPSQTRAAEVEKHHRVDGQNAGADEEDAGVFISD